MKRLKSLILISLIICITLLSALPTLAAEPTYKVSDKYRESKYYDNLIEVPITGEMAQDLLSVALSQLGYHEGNGDNDLHGLNKKGSRDFTEYNVLYGKLDNNQGNGLSHGYYWCASFVNWCLRQAKVPLEDSCGAKVSCWKWLEAFEEAGMYCEKGDYIPSSADLIFFKDSTTYVRAGHIGIVLYCDGETVYTIEGNTARGDKYSGDGDCVALKSYPLYSEYIVGYAKPNYGTNSKITRPDYSGESLACGLYISTEDIQCFSDKELSAESTVIGQYTVFKVTDLLGESFEIETDGEKCYAKLFGKAKAITKTKESFSVKVYNNNEERRFFYDEGDRIPLPQSSAPDSSGFVGYALSMSDPADILPEGYMLTEDRVLYEIWDGSIYTVTYMTSTGEKIGEVKGKFGDSLPAIDYGAPEGYVFEKWDTEPAEIIKGDATYTAVLRKKTASESIKETLGCNSSIGYSAILACLAAISALAFKKKNDL